MMTLRRLRVLTESYGADLRRWPRNVRDQAQRLLSSSDEARALFEDARRLDAAIETASAHADSRRWPSGEQDAALARLRSGVAARIAAEAASPVRQAASATRRFGWLPSGFDWGTSLGLRRVGLVTGAVFAIVAGLLIGTMYGAAPPAGGVLSMLVQPAALEILPD